jgi:hypothetical protein
MALLQLSTRCSRESSSRSGGLSLGDMWLFEGREPGRGLVVRSTSDGAVIYPAGWPAPRVGSVRSTPDRRMLHIGAGVNLADVGAFVDSLPEALRPANYTIALGA